MGFQLPPTLPDYSKLSVLLNNSGVQKWNPSVYDILKQLIFAVQQSQGVLVDGGITNIVNNSITNGGIIIPPSVSGLIFSATGSLLVTVPASTGNQPFNAKTIFGTIPAVSGKTIWPLAIYVTGGQTITGSGGAWNTATGWEVVWNGVSVVLAAGAGQIFTTSFTTSSFTNLHPPPSVQATITGSAFQNIDLNIRTANTGTILGSTFPASTVTNYANWSIIYTLV